MPELEHYVDKWLQKRSAGYQVGYFGFHGGPGSLSLGGMRYVSLEDLEAIIDGLNLFYGGRSICGRDQPGWRWLDLRQLVLRLMAARQQWSARGAVLDRIVYCTAFVEGRRNSNSRKHQDRYIAALRQHGSFDQLLEGKFVARVVRSPLAVVGSDGKPLVVTSQWPIMVQDASGVQVPDAVFMASHIRSEEKRTDVNLASQLLIDVLEQRVDAAIVISNDSDLGLPIRESRQRVPVGTVNPSSRWLAGDLAGEPRDGVGGHWWYQLTAADFTICQLPDPVGILSKPTGW